MDHQSPVSVYTVTDPLEAEIIQNALRAEGIVCELDGLNQAGLKGIFEISILTKAADADRARAIVEHHEQRLAHNRKKEHLPE
jgi:hypothetical protein